MTAETLLLVVLLQVAGYDPAGRRDPFVSYVALEAAQRGSCPATGLAARLLQEVTLTGIVRTVSGPKALLAGANRETHFAGEGALLCDGRVLRIEKDAVVFVQQLADPLAPGRTVEVRRSLHPGR
jgi:hypothetical protein